MTGGSRIRDVLEKAAELLRSSEVDSPRRTAEVLLARTLGWERPRLIAHDLEALPEPMLSLFLQQVRRRAEGVPLQYLTGEQEFFGLAFEVGPAVLIPRPETEILVERAIALARRSRGPVTFADIGTGSGCIAVSFAACVPEARGVAVDISREGLNVARSNARRHGVAGRVRFVCGNLLACFPERPIFDFVLSNPPYVALRDAHTLPALVREHEPSGALFAGESGLECLETLVPQATARLRPGGYLLVEVGAGQHGDVEPMMERAGLGAIETLADLQGIGRCVVARRSPGGGDDG